MGFLRLQGLGKLRDFRFTYTVCHWGFEAYRVLGSTVQWALELQALVCLMHCWACHNVMAFLIL